MSVQFELEKPVIYADMNIFRYVGRGDITIVEPERFIWVYSHVHLDELHRNYQEETLQGICDLKAIELCEVIENYKATGDLFLSSFKDPFLRYEEYLRSIEGYENTAEYFFEFMMKAYGADNFKSLERTPEQFRAEVTKLIDDVPDINLRNDMQKEVEEVAGKLDCNIQKHMKEHNPIDKTRNALGVTSVKREKLKESASVIDDIWNLVEPSMEGSLSKNQFFGFEPIPNISESLNHTQHSSIQAAYMVLNILGINPDKGMAKKEKIKNVFSDSCHAGLASYCQILLSADRGIINKSKHLYQYLGCVTHATLFEYKKGVSIDIVIEDAS
ncbi:hypothetical protein NH514_04755 [Pseudoalteromonas sp. ACER1]|uniref:hypothetical protein n=1 Tax=unclassified Pseudoalteromonas TaxID=194690 RepID=UPI001F3A7CF7|nr:MULTISPECIES: hypothetical protein [unclassified Pseudoalteromonas]MCF2846576.1 hypothetical protein [Pseudoalteromonas sp. PAST1]MCO7210047.1 hypothetical protein [Pseudoalteromonas sp. ACER1]